MRELDVKQCLKDKISKEVLSFSFYLPFLQPYKILQDRWQIIEYDSEHSSRAYYPQNQGE